jgi:hypothetical protein
MVVGAPSSARPAHEARDVPGADDGEEATARRLADALREVGVTLVDQHGLEARERLAELGEEARQHVRAAQLAQVFLGELLAFEQRGAEGGEKQRALPEAEGAPRAAERHADVAVAERDGDAGVLGGARRLEQLGAGPHAEAEAERALIGREREIEPERCELAGADHLAQIERLEALRAREGLEALRVELDADGVGAQLGDRAAHEIDRLARDVRGAEHDDLALGEAHDAHVFGGEDAHRRRSLETDPGVARGVDLTIWTI